MTVGTITHYDNTGNVMSVYKNIDMSNPNFSIKNGMVITFYDKTTCGKVGNVITKNNGFCEYTCFTLVTECVVRNPNHDIVDITWHNIFSPISLTILKGDCVMVKGSLRTKRYTNSKGEDRYCVEVVAKEVELIKE